MVIHGIVSTHVETVALLVKEYAHDDEPASIKVDLEEKFGARDALMNSDMV